MLKSKFDEAVQLTLHNEGGYIDNPNDSGGATKYGITQKDILGIDVKDISEEFAIYWYQEHYWKPLYDQINDQDILNKLFDMGVLFGIGEAAYLLQRALNFLPPQWTKVFDEPTLLATNVAVPADLLKRYKMHLLAHATNIVNANPKDSVFKDGWQNRIEL